MPKSYWTKVQTPNGLKYFRADDVTDELLDKLKDEANDVFYVEYGTTTFAEAEAAYLAGKTLVCREIGQTVQQTRMDDLYFLIDYMPTAGTYTGHFVFSNITGYVQTRVRLTPSTTYEKTITTLATRQEVVDSLSAEIAPDYQSVVNEYTTEDKFPIPAGTYVTYLDNTSSDVLQYLYKSKVAIERQETASSDPLTAPAKWDKVTVTGSVGKVVYVTPFSTPYDDIQNAYDAGNTILANLSGSIYTLSDYDSYQHIFSFSRIAGDIWMQFRCCKDQYPSTNDWDPNPSIVNLTQHGQIAPDYSSTLTYEVGDLVYSNGSLYRCTTAISTPESWTPAHWTQTTVTDELNKLKNEQPVLTYSFRDDHYPSGADIWNAVSTGRVPMLKRTQMYVTRIYMMTQYGSHGNERDVYFYSFQNRDILRLHTPNGTTWTWTSSDMYDSSLNSIGTNAVQNATLYAVIGNVETLLAAL